MEINTFTCALWNEASVQCSLRSEVSDLGQLEIPRGVHCTYFGYGDVPLGRVSIFKILV